MVEDHVAVEELSASPLVVAATAFETQAEDDAAEDPKVVILATTFLGHHLEVAEEEDRCVEAEAEGCCEGEEEGGLQHWLNHSLNGMGPILLLQTCHCQSHYQNHSYRFGIDPDSTRQSLHRSPTRTWPRYPDLESHPTTYGKPEPGSGQEQRGLMLKRSRLQSC